VKNLLLPVLQLRNRLDSPKNMILYHCRRGICRIASELEAFKPGIAWRRVGMAVTFSRTMESPCRTCENVHLNKEECSRNCARLQAFQDAIIHYDERSIKDFGVRYNLLKTQVG